MKCPASQDSDIVQRETVTARVTPYPPAFLTYSQRNSREGRGEKGVEVLLLEPLTA